MLWSIDSCQKGTGTGSGPNFLIVKKLCFVVFDCIARFVSIQLTQPRMTSCVQMLKILLWVFLLYSLIFKNGVKKVTLLTSCVQSLQFSSNKDEV